jgi:hypothetical protein
MTARTTTPRERAEWTRKIVEAALTPGGPLHVDLSSLIVEAETMALKHLGVDVEHVGKTEWSFDLDGEVVEDIAYRIAEAIFKSTVAYLEADPDAPRAQPERELVTAGG